MPFNTYRESLKMNPHQPDVYMHMGLAYSRLKDFQKFYDSYVYAYKLTPP